MHIHTRLTTAPKRDSPPLTPKGDRRRSRAHRPRGRARVRRRLPAQVGRRLVHRAPAGARACAACAPPTRGGGGRVGMGGAAARFVHSRETADHRAPARRRTRCACRRRCSWAAAAPRPRPRCAGRSWSSCARRSRPRSARGTPWQARGAGACGGPRPHAPLRARLGGACKRGSRRGAAPTARATMRARRLVPRPAAAARGGAARRRRRRRARPRRGRRGAAAAAAARDARFWQAPGFDACLRWRRAASVNDTRGVVGGGGGGGGGAAAGAAPLWGGAEAEAIAAAAAAAGGGEL